MMKKLKIKYPEFLHPQLWRSFPIRTTVENGAVEVLSDRLLFDGESFPDGSRVELTGNRFWIDCVTVESIEEAARAAEQRRTRSPFGERTHGQ